MDLKISHRYEPLFELLDGKYPEVDTVIETGGRNSQKSFATGTFACIGAKDYGYRALYTRYTLTAAADSIIPEFTEKINLLNCADRFTVTKDRIVGDNNSKIVFKGIKTGSGNQTAALKSLKNFNCFICEEAEEVPDFETWDKIKKSIRANDVRNLNIIILNPTSKLHWIFEEFFESRGVPEGFNGVVDNVLYIHTTYLDMEREFIADSIWNDFEVTRKAYEAWSALPDYEKDHSPLKRKAKYYKHTVLGGWLDKSEGVIFDNWTIGEFQNQGNITFGNDFGFSVDPTTLARISVNKAEKKIYIREECYKSRMTTTDIANVMFSLCGDDVVVADSAEPRLIAELQNKGLNVIPALKGPGSIKEGIALLLSYELIIDPSSLNLIKELNNYAWSNKRAETPVDAHNHLIDAIRYAVMHYLIHGGKAEVEAGW